MKLKKSKSWNEHAESTATLYQVSTRKETVLKTGRKPVSCRMYVETSTMLTKSWKKFRLCTSRGTSFYANPLYPQRVGSTISISFNFIAILNKRPTIFAHNLAIRTTTCILGEDCRRCSQSLLNTGCPFFFYKEGVSIGRELDFGMAKAKSNYNHGVASHSCACF